MRNFRRAGTAPFVIVMAIVVTGIEPTSALAQSASPSSASTCSAIPANIAVDRALSTLVERAIASSTVVQRQCQTIAGARHVRVTIRVYPGRLLGGIRARATITRYEFGAIWADIVIPLGVNQTEMLAHELEHVIEQMDGVRLDKLAGAPIHGVSQFADGSYETARAERAGRMAVRESEASSAPGTTGVVSFNVKK